MDFQAMLLLLLRLFSLKFAYADNVIEYVIGNSFSGIRFPLERCSMESRRKRENHGG